MKKVECKRSTIRWNISFREKLIWSSRWGGWDGGVGNLPGIFWEISGNLEGLSEHSYWDCETANQKFYNLLAGKMILRIMSDPPVQYLRNIIFYLLVVFSYHLQIFCGFNSNTLPCLFRLTNLFSLMGFQYYTFRIHRQYKHIWHT